MSVAGDHSVLRLPAYTEQAALAWLRERGEFSASPTELGEQWGCTKQVAHRYLSRWDARKFVRFKGAGKKRKVVYLAGATDAAPTPAPMPASEPSSIPTPQVLSAPLSSEVTARVRAASKPSKVPASETVSAPVTRTGLPDVPDQSATKNATVSATVRATITAKLLAATIFLIGVAFSAGPLWLTPTSWYLFGAVSSQSAAYFMAGFGLLVAFLSVVSLAAASASPNRAWAATFAFMWALAVLIEGATAIGFMYANIGTSVGSREELIEERTKITARIEELQGERLRLAGTPRTSEAQAQAATSTRVRECQRGGQCSKAIADEKRILENRTNSARKDEIGTEIATLEAKHKVLPFVAVADPLISGLIEVVTWATSGSWTPSERTIRNIRLLMFAFVPDFLPGLLIAGAYALCRRRPVKS